MHLVFKRGQASILLLIFDRVFWLLSRLPAPQQHSAGPIPSKLERWWKWMSEGRLDGIRAWRRAVCDLPSIHITVQSSKPSLNAASLDNLLEKLGSGDDDSRTALWIEQTRNEHPMSQPPAAARPTEMDHFKVWNARWNYGQASSPAVPSDQHGASSHRQKQHQRRRSEDSERFTGFRTNGGNPASALKSGTLNRLKPLQSAKGSVKEAEPIKTSVEATAQPMRALVDREVESTKSPKDPPVTFNPKEKTRPRGNMVNVEPTLVTEHRPYSQSSALDSKMDVGVKNQFTRNRHPSRLARASSI